MLLIVQLLVFPIVQATWDIEQNKMTMEMQLNACVILNAHNNNIIKFSNIIIPMSFLWKCLRSVSETSWFIDITGPFIHNSISASNKRNFKRKSGFKWAASQAIKISIMVEKPSILKMIHNDIHHCTFLWAGK